MCAAASLSLSGSERTVRRFCVTSSPNTPSPRVAPRTNTPCSYSSDTERPSIFISVTYSQGPNSSSSRAPKASSSSSLNTSVRLPIGTLWRTFSKRCETRPPTRCVGDVGEASSGCAASNRLRASNMRSYSLSSMTGASSS